MGKIHFHVLDTNYMWNVVVWTLFCSCPIQLHSSVPTFEVYYCVLLRSVGHDYMDGKSKMRETFWKFYNAFTLTLLNEG